MKAKKPRQMDKPWELTITGQPEQNIDIFAVQALYAGTADAYQQQRAVAFIERLCGAERMSFWPGAEDGRRATDFAEGKRWVATQLRRISRLKPKEMPARGAPPPMPGEPDEDGPQSAEDK